jgi:predicted RNase H-like HicB family nuclease
MRTVTVVYHCEDGAWWADSPDPGLETFVAGADTLDETRRLAGEGLEFFVGDKVALIETLEDGKPVDGPLVVNSVAIDTSGLSRDVRTATMPVVVHVRMSQPQPIEARGEQPVLARGAA